MYIYIYIHIYIYTYTHTYRGLDRPQATGYMQKRGNTFGAPGPGCLHPLLLISKAPKGNGTGATGSKNWVWF